MTEVPGRIQIGNLTFGEVVEVSLQDVALECEVGELALAVDLDAACRLRFFHGMRNRGGADGLSRADVGAGYTAASGDLLEYLVAARVGEGTRNQDKLPVGESNSLSVSHAQNLPFPTPRQAGAEEMSSYLSLTNFIAASQRQTAAPPKIPRATQMLQMVSCFFYINFICLGSAVVMRTRSTRRSVESRTSNFRPSSSMTSPFFGILPASSLTRPAIVDDSWPSGRMPKSSSRRSTSMLPGTM